MMSGPQNIYIDNNELFVANGGGNTIAVFPQTASGNVAPTRVISGSSTNISYPDQLQIVGTEIFSANYSNSSVQVFPTSASGNTVPTRSLTGASTLINGTLGLVVF
jgi:6-phosphogluconolactonase (cycloisomerase 2 family)